MNWLWKKNGSFCVVITVKHERTHDYKIVKYIKFLQMFDMAALHYSAYVQSVNQLYCHMVSNMYKLIKANEVLIRDFNPEMDLGSGRLKSSLKKTKKKIHLNLGGERITD